MRQFTTDEAAECIRLYRLGWSYMRIAVHLGRNHASIGYVIRREDRAEEERLVEEERGEHARRS